MATSGARNTTRQREAGAASRAETRRRLLRAAGEEFSERGYHAATVTRIAGRAGVTVQTLYLAWGSKRALLRAVMDASLSGDPDTSYADQLPDMLAQALDSAGDDAQATIERFARMFRKVAERAALGWRLYRDASAADAEVAVDWQTLQQLRRHTCAELIQRIPAASRRAGVSLDAAVDTTWAIASPETYELLVTAAGYSLDAYERWVAQTLCAAVLDERRDQ